MKKIWRGMLGVLLVFAVLITVLPVGAWAETQELHLQITPSVSQVTVGDVIEYTVTATGQNLMAMEWKLALPEGLGYVENSAQVPQGLAELLGWAETDWTEETKKWTGYNDTGVEIPQGTVLLTFRAVALEAGSHRVEVNNLYAYNGDYLDATYAVTADSVTAVPAPPTKVTGLEANNLQQTSFDLSWDAIAGASKYWIYLDGSLLLSTTQASATVTKRSPGTAYQVKVTARLADGTVLSLSEAEALTVTTPGAVITAPKATAVADEAGITLTWDATNCAKTWIYLGTTRENLKLLYACTQGTFTLTGLESDTTYYIHLSHSMGGTVIASQEVLEVKTPAAKNPLRVTGLQAAKVQSNDFTLTWDAIPGATKYWVYIDGALNASTAAASASVTKRSPGTSYQVKITACLADGTVLKLADATALTVTTPGQAITIPTATAVAGAGTINLTWDNTDCDKTWIYLGTSPENLALLRSSTQGSYTVTGLEENTTYYLRLTHYIGGRVVSSEQILEVTVHQRPNLAVNAQLTQNRLDLTWEANEGSYKYWVTVVRNGKTLIYSTTDRCFSIPDFDPATCRVSIRGINPNGTYDYDPIVI